VVLTGTGNLNAVANTLDDTLIGNAGDNQFTAGPGTDIIDGRAGTDTVVYSGHRADYATSLDNDTQRRNGAPDGVSIVSNIEMFKFVDGTKHIVVQHADYEQSRRNEHADCL
jgi:serralysin